MRTVSRFVLALSILVASFGAGVSVGAQAASAPATERHATPEPPRLPAPTVEVSTPTTAAARPSTVTTATTAATSSTVRATSTTVAAPQPPAPAPPPQPAAPTGSVEAIIRAAAAEFGVGGDLMVRIARCESGLNPAAVNASSGALGLFQHLPRYWPGRAAGLGYSSADWSNPTANARVSAVLLRDGGPGHWRACL